MVEKMFSYFLFLIGLIDFFLNLFLALEKKKNTFLKLNRNRSSISVSADTFFFHIWQPSNSMGVTESPVINSFST